jgi:hypothetical protein
VLGDPIMVPSKLGGSLRSFPRGIMTSSGIVEWRPGGDVVSSLLSTPSAVGLLSSIKKSSGSKCHIQHGQFKRFFSADVPPRPLDDVGSPSVSTSGR